MLSRVPFPVDDTDAAFLLTREMKEKGVLVDTRGDYTQFERDFEDQLYVVVYTGNISGLVFDLEVEGFL